MLAAAKRHFPAAAGFVFPRRTVTREAQADAEDHDTVQAEEFNQLEKSGGFALSWQAHGLSYGIPASIIAELAAGRQVPVEVWAVGSEIECHPAFGSPELQGYARSKRAYARAAARLVYAPDVLYRHIVPSAFRSAMGPGLVGGGTAAAVAFWLIRRGFRYVPVTYTGVAYLNALPYSLRALWARAAEARGARGAEAPSLSRPAHTPSAGR